MDLQTSNTFHIFRPEVEAVSNNRNYLSPGGKSQRKLVSPRLESSRRGVGSKDPSSGNLTGRTQTQSVVSLPSSQGGSEGRGGEDQRHNSVNITIHSNKNLIQYAIDQGQQLARVKRDALAARKKSAAVGGRNQKTRQSILLQHSPLGSPLKGVGIASGKRMSTLNDPRMALLSSRGS
jgi:hypothetical protein